MTGNATSPIGDKFGSIDNLVPAFAVAVSPVNPQDRSADQHAGDRIIIIRRIPGISHRCQALVPEGALSLRNDVDFIQRASRLA
jgi:hypothetical protein